MRVWFLGLMLAGCAPSPLGAMALFACDAPAPSVVVNAQTLEVGCGTCMFKQAGGQGCYWAAKVGDTVYPMKGKALPSEKDLPSHGPEGMCTLMRSAVVTGEVRGGLLYVTAFELHAAEPDAARADPHNHEH
jgi:hypothetical protein